MPQFSTAYHRTRVCLCSGFCVNQRVNVRRRFLVCVVIGCSSGFEITVGSRIGAYRRSK